MGKGYVYSTDPKIAAVEHALLEHDPFCAGMCPIPDYQRLFYYKANSDFCRIDFSSVTPHELEALYHACEPAEFVPNGENVLDGPYHKAGKMDLTSFATSLDLRHLGIQDQVHKALLTENFSSSMEIELYKLDVYGKGDFFKAHKSTPRRHNMFGSLVVILPTFHEGGQFVLCQSQKEWTINCADKISTATETSICFIGFYGDLEYEVLPITAGYRIALTYNLYSNPVHPTMSILSTPFHLRLRQELAELVNDLTQLPNGGYLGFGLVHEYAQTRDDIQIESLLDRLKGSDRALVDACGALGLPCSIRLLYRDPCGEGDDGPNFLTTRALDIKAKIRSEEDDLELSVNVKSALGKVSSDVCEGFRFAGQEELEDDTVEPGLAGLFANPVTEVLEVTRMRSSVYVKSPVLTYGYESLLKFVDGTACLLVGVEPAKKRRQVGP